MTRGRCTPCRSPSGRWLCLLGGSAWVSSTSAMSRAERAVRATLGNGSVARRQAACTSWGYSPSPTRAASAEAYCAPLGRLPGLPLLLPTHTSLGLWVPKWSWACMLWGLLPPPWTCSWLAAGVHVHVRALIHHHYHALVRGLDLGLGVPSASRMGPSGSTAGRLAIS